MVELQPSKLIAWVRFPSPAPNAHIAQSVEHFLGKEEVVSSILIVSTTQSNRCSRPVAQLAERRSPKPQVGGSIPSWPAIIL